MLMVSCSGIKRARALAYVISGSSSSSCRDAASTAVRSSPSVCLSGLVQYFLTASASGTRGWSSVPLESVLTGVSPFAAATKLSVRNRLCRLLPQSAAHLRARGASSVRSQRGHMPVCQPRPQQARPRPLPAPRRAHCPAWPLKPKHKNGRGFLRP